MAICKERLSDAEENDHNDENDQEEQEATSDSGIINNLSGFEDELTN